MAIPPSTAFQSKIASLPVETTTVWATDLASAVASLVDNMITLSPIVCSNSFTFQQGVFAQQLLSIQPGLNASVQANLIATAWATAVQSSTIVVLPGAFLGAPAPPTLFSTIISSVIDSSSIASAKSLLVSKLTSEQPVSIGVQNKFGAALHDAFLLLTCSVTGLNSNPPPPAGTGPIPLMAPTNAFQ